MWVTVCEAEERFGGWEGGVGMRVEEEAWWAWWVGSCSHHMCVCVRKHEIGNTCVFVCALRAGRPLRARPSTAHLLVVRGGGLQAAHKGAVAQLRLRVGADDPKGEGRACGVAWTFSTPNSVCSPMTQEVIPAKAVLGYLGERNKSRHKRRDTEALPCRPPGPWPYCHDA